MNIYKLTIDKAQRVLYNGVVSERRANGQGNSAKRRKGAKMNEQITITNTPESLQALATFLRQHCPQLLVSVEGGWGYAKSVTLSVFDGEIEIVDNDDLVVIE